MEGGKEDKGERENKRNCFIKASLRVRSSLMKALKMLHQNVPGVLDVPSAR